MKANDTIKKVGLAFGQNTINLDRIYPIRIIELEASSIGYYINDKLSEPFDDKTVYANKIVIETDRKTSVEIVLGKGYFAEIDSDWTERFCQRQGWTGGDGIYSFNLTDGCDSFDQKKKATNLFVFGDTLVGRVDPVTKQRYEPLLMPNNSLAYLGKETDQIKFQLNKTEKDAITAFFRIDPQADVKGCLPQNLVSYDRHETNDGWVSGFDPKYLWLVFDLAKKSHVTHLEITNYYSKESPVLSTRGIKIFQLFGSDNESEWTFIGEYKVEQSLSEKDVTLIEIDQEFRYFKFDINPECGIGNYDDNSLEKLFGLRLVKFFDGEKLYRDVAARGSSLLLEEKANAWIWLQDGVVINDMLYIFPYTVIQDLRQPEGLQFAIKGISMIRVPIVRERLNHQASYQKETPFCLHKDGTDYMLGGAVMADTLQAGMENAGNYIYVYGYKTTLGFREMIASRCTPETIELFDTWEFYDGKSWQHDLLKAKGLIDHVSTEFSVSKLLDGPYKDKYLAVFTFDTNTKEIAFAIGDSPVGPFTKPQVIYITPEQELFGKTTYTYNAKCHPQLSESTNILVSYNTNTYSFAHNMENGDVYRPRFIRLKAIQ